MHNLHKKVSKKLENPNEYVIINFAPFKVADIGEFLLWQKIHRTIN